MTIVVYGCDGQLGAQLVAALSANAEVVALNRKGLGNLENLSAIDSTLQRYQPEIVINAAAYTQVDQAESEAEKADLINHRAVAELAKSASAQGALLIHFSTDYVYSGQGQRPWLETDVAEPVNVYGATKLAGDQAVQRFADQYVILRTSWVYSTRPGCFLGRIVSKALAGEPLTVVDDQVGSPTSVGLISDAVELIVRRYRERTLTKGLYHLVPNGTTSWHGFAAYILELLKVAHADFSWPSLEAIPTSALTLNARRPLNSRLDNSKYQNEFDVLLPDWRLDVANTLAAMPMFNTGLKADE